MQRKLYYNFEALKHHLVSILLSISHLELRTIWEDSYQEPTFWIANTESTMNPLFYSLQHHSATIIVDSCLYPFRVHPQWNLRNHIELPNYYQIHLIATIEFIGNEPDSQYGSFLMSSVIKKIMPFLVTVNRSFISNGGTGRCIENVRGDCWFHGEGDYDEQGIVSFHFLFFRSLLKPWLNSVMRNFIDLVRILILLCSSIWSFKMSFRVSLKWQKRKYDSFEQIKL